MFALLLVSLHFGVDPFGQGMGMVVFSSIFGFIFDFGELIPLSGMFTFKHLLLIVVPSLLGQMPVVFRRDIAFLFFFFNSIVLIKVCFHGFAAHLYSIFAHMLLFDIFIQGVFVYMLFLFFQIINFVCFDFDHKFLFTFGIACQLSFLVVLIFLFLVVIVQFII